jgi:hypothetical protein
MCGTREKGQKCPSLSQRPILWPSNGKKTARGRVFDFNFTFTIQNYFIDSISHPMSFLIMVVLKNNDAHY